MLLPAVSAPSSKTRARTVLQGVVRDRVVKTENCNCNGKGGQLHFSQGEKTFLPPFSEIGDTDACVCVTSALHHDEVHTRKREGWPQTGFGKSEKERRYFISSTSQHSSCRTNPFPAMKVFSLSVTFNI